MDVDKIIEKAKQDYEREAFDEAITGFQNAHDAARASGDELRTAEMANNLSVIYLKTKKAKLALEVVEGTDKVFAQHNDPIKQAMYEKRFHTLH